MEHEKEHKEHKNTESKKDSESLTRSKKSGNSIKKTTLLFWLVGLALILTLINVYNTFDFNSRLTALETRTVLGGQPLGEQAEIREVQPQQQQQEQPERQQAPSPTTVSADDDAVIGDPNAPVTIIEFSDFECPFCARFYSQTLGQIDEQYIQTGKVKLVFRDFPLGFHQNAQKAAEAAECAGDQDKFWEMHDELFENYNALEVSNLKKYAADLGLNTDDFDDCLDSDKYKNEVQKDFRDGQSAGVSGTPSFFINGVKVVGAQPFSAFEEVIEQELNK